MQIVHFSRKGARSIEHIGSAHDDAELAVLKEVARQRLNAGQLSVDLPGLSGMNVAGSGPQAPAGAECVASITFKRMGVLLEALETAWKAVGLDRLDGADEVFRQLVTARLIEPSSKQDSSRVVADAGMINAATRPSTTATAPTEPDAPYAGSIPRSPRPRKPSQERSPSSATASCTCPVPRGASTATWRKGPGPWPGGSVTSLICPTPTPTPRQSSAPTTAYTTSRSPLRMSKFDLRARPIYHPPAPVHRGPPDHRHRRPGHGPLAGDHHRLVHQTPDQHCTPLPHHYYQHRRTHPHSRRPSPTQPRPSPPQYPPRH